MRRGSEAECRSARLSTVGSLIFMTRPCAHFPEHDGLGILLEGLPIDSHDTIANATGNNPLVSGARAITSLTPSTSVTASGCHFGPASGQLATRGEKEIGPRSCSG